MLRSLQSIRLYSVLRLAKLINNLISKHICVLSSEILLVLGLDTQARVCAHTHTQVLDGGQVRLVVMENPCDVVMFTVSQPFESWCSEPRQGWHAGWQDQTAHCTVGHSTTWPSH